MSESCVLLGTERRKPTHPALQRATGSHRAPEPCTAVHTGLAARRCQGCLGFFPAPLPSFPGPPFGWGGCPGDAGFADGMGEDSAGVAVGVRVGVGAVADVVGRGVGSWWREPTAGGLASTVFAPITAALADHFSWRTTYAILAAILALNTVPAHALALRAPWPPPPEPPTHATSSNKQDTVALSRSFLLLAAAFALSGFAVYAVVIGLVPLLAERGASSTTAAWALGRGGAGQTLGRTL